MIVESLFLLLKLDCGSPPSKARNNFPLCTQSLNLTVYVSRAGVIMFQWLTKVKSVKNTLHRPPAHVARSGGHPGHNQFSCPDHCHHALLEKSVSAACRVPLRHLELTRHLQVGWQREAAASSLTLSFPVIVTNTESYSFPKDKGTKIAHVFLYLRNGQHLLAAQQFPAWITLSP